MKLTKITSLLLAAALSLSLTACGAAPFLPKALPKVLPFLRASSRARLLLLWKPLLTLPSPIP